MRAQHSDTERTYVHRTFPLFFWQPINQYKPRCVEDVCIGGRRQAAHGAGGHFAGMGSRSTWKDAKQLKHNRTLQTLQRPT